MSMNSLIADTISRINNGYRVSQEFVLVRSSKMVKSILKVLQEEGYILGFEEVVQRDKINLIKVDLKYLHGKAAIEKMKMISRPGCRRYAAVAELPRSCNGFGVVIVSTSRGVMSDARALEERVGGEIICEVY